MARIRLAILITLLATGTAAARIITVDDDGLADFTNIQAAIDDAESWDTVIVAPGRYAGIDFRGRRIRVKSETGPEDCIIDESDAEAVIIFHSGERGDSILEGFTITGNHWRGGIYIKENSSPVIKNCLIVDNGSEYGGGITCIDSCPSIINCTIANNSATYSGGAVYYGRSCGYIVNCAIIGNRSSFADSGGLSFDGGSPHIINCTIVGNTGNERNFGIDCEGSRPPIINCVIWGNELHNCPLPTYSCWPNGWEGTGNIHSYPQFIDPEGGDYRLLPYSPCVDAGTNDRASGETDLAGYPRLIDGDRYGAAIVDMGAYETPIAQYPVIDVSGTRVDFIVDANNMPPEDLQMTIHNRGGGVLDWAIGYDCDWLEVFPATGQSSGQQNEVSLSINTQGLLPGTHICELTVSSLNALNTPETVSVALHYVNDEVHVPSQFPTIQDAVDNVLEGRAVVVADGIYRGSGNRDIDFRGKAITVRSESGPENCIIDCEGTDAESHRGFDFHAGEDADSILQGFTITNGYAHGPGGAIRCVNRSSPTIMDCIIANNISGKCVPSGGGRGEGLECTVGDGGGIYCIEGSSPTIENCSISNNTAVGSGGGIFCEDGSTVIRGCTITGNSAGRGGGIRSGEHADTRITGCVISDNSAGGGGGISCGGRSHQDGAVITNCIINDNAAEYGGAIASSRDRIDVNNCIITGNTATSSGGAISCSQSRPTFVNCTVADNLAGSAGGAVSGGGYGRASFFNCIVWDNRAEMGDMAATGGCMSIVGCMDMRFSYSCIQSGSNAVWVDGYYEMDLGDNISADPRFADPNNGDFRLNGDSPCIDAGENELPDGLPESDIEGSDRMQDGDRDGLAVVDMGAYEAAPIEELVIWPSASGIDFFVEEGGAGEQTQTLLIRERAGRLLHWTVISNGSWLRVTPTSGISTELPSEVALAVDANGLGVGAYNSSLVVSDPNAINNPVVVTVALHVLGDTVHVPVQFGTIQDAIDHTAEGGMVIIADGIYRGPGNRDIDFKGKAITVRSENGPDACVIYCDGSDAEPHRGFKFHSGESQSSILDGITIVDANGHSYMDVGGAIYCEQSSPTIKNCRITDGGIGGIACYESDPYIFNCTISRNQLWGISCGMGNPVIDNCTITEAYTGIEGSGDSLIRRCTVCNNSRGGLFFYDGSPTVLDSVICNNGGEYGWEGGGIYIDNRTGIPAEIRNCTISGNTAHYGGGIYLYRGNLALTNCIVWGNSPDQMYGSNEGFFVTYSNVEGGWGGVDIIDADPCFIEPALLDYRLTADSPCIDIGDPNSTATDDQTDIDGDPRIIGGYIDLGADEFAPRPIIRITPREVNFAAEYNGDNPEHQIVNIDNTGVGALEWQIVEDCPWLEVEPAHGQSVDQATQVTLTVDIAGLAIGAHECSLTVVDPCATNNPQTIRVMLDIFGDTVYVPAEMPTIQDAIDYVLPSGTVVVADGNYTGPGNWDIDFRGKVITVRSQNGPEHCIVDCLHTYGHGGFSFHSGETASSVVDGFTITRGYSSAYGSAIRCDASSPTIRNCTIRDHYGYAVYFTGDAHPVITMCDIVYNNNLGIYCSQESYPTISDCLIAFTDDSGGPQTGIICRSQSAPTIERCTIRGNARGIECSGNSEPIVKDCRIIANSYGIVIDDSSKPVISRSLITGKYGSSGYGISNSSKGSPIIENCTIVGTPSTDVFFSYDCPITLRNCIIWDCKIVFYYAKDVQAQYCDIQGGWPGLGNIDVDPLFARSAYMDANGSPDDANDDFWVDGDYHLRSEGWCWDAVREVWTWDDVSSRCIDAGDPDSALGDEPVSVPGDPNNDWGRSVRINMGAYGGTALASIPPNGWVVREDYNNDGITNFTDLACWSDNYVYSASKRIRQEASDLALFAQSWLDRTTWFEAPAAVPPHLPPGKASDPSPPDGDTGVSIYKDPSWQADPFAVSYDVYFAATNPPPFLQNQSGSTLELAQLNESTTYYWRIDEINEFGMTTGDVWTFTTRDQ